MPYLPNEIIWQIVDAADDKDLCNLRATCKALCALTQKRFGLAFFATRYFVVSDDSINTLLEITQHPVFGPYVRTVVVDCIRMMQPEAGKVSVLEKAIDEMRSAKHSLSMCRVFRAIHQHGNEITIGLVGDARERTRRSDGLYDEANALACVLDLAKSTACVISGVSIRLSSYSAGAGTSQDKLDDIVPIAFQPLGSRALKLQLQPDELGSAVDPYFAYCPRKQSFEAVNFEYSRLDDMITYMNYHLRPNISQICLDNCALFDPFVVLREMVTFSIESLTSFDVNMVKMGHMDEWLSLLELLRTAPNLQYCRVTGASYRNHDRLLPNVSWLCGDRCSFIHEGEGMSAALEEFALQAQGALRYYM